jgi:hypothetical protein
MIDSYRALQTRGSDCSSSSRHPLSMRCTYPAGSFHCVSLFACTYLTVGHVLAESRAVGLRLHTVAGLEVGVLRL